MTIGIGTPIGSNNTNGTLSIGNHPRSGVWANFDEVFELGNGKRVRTAAIYKLRKHELTTRSIAGIGHLLKHQKACRKKVDQSTGVQSRIPLNPEGSVRL